jgi:hypothetical protein
MRNQDRLFYDIESNPGLPEEEAVVLNTQRRRSVLRTRADHS